MHARNNYDKELEDLNLDLIKMGSLIEEAIENSVAAFKNNDRTLAEKVINNDSMVDDLERQIESKCLHLILRQQPVAIDLRKISTALKMITDMERIGDNAADIAELSIEITGEQIFDIVKHIPQMSDIAVQMVHDAITSYVNTDLELARRVIQTDDEVDSLFDMVKKDLSDILKKDKDTENNSIDFLMIAKYLERIADHAVNICEWVEFYKTGEHKNKRIL